MKLISEQVRSTSIRLTDKVDRFFWKVGFLSDYRVSVATAFLEVSPSRSRS